MAKTTSQIIAENKIKRAEAAAIAASRDKIHQKQMAGVAEESAAQTLAVLNKAISGTTDSTKKSELSRAAQMVTAEYKKASSKKKSEPNKAVVMQKKKEDQAEEKYQLDSLQTKKNQAQKALDDFDNNKEIDWTDTNQRKAYDAERKQLQDEVDRAGAEIDARKDAATHDANMEQIASMNAEDREQLQQYVESRDARRSVFANPISWYQDYNKETENKNALIDKYGEEELAKLEETYSRHLHEQSAKKTVEDTQESVNQNWIAAALHNIAAVPARAMGGIEAMAGRLYEQADRTGQYRTLEENTAGDTLSLYGNTVSGQTAQNIAGENGNVVRGALSIGYQGVMSVVDSIARTFFGGGAAGGAALAATNSFTQTVSEATKQGASPQQAVTLGVGKAGIEYLTEKYSIDEVFKFAKAGDANVWKSAFKQVGVEITTEEATLFGSLALEAAVLRGKSSYKQKIGELVTNGKSYEEAKAQADKDVWNEVLQTAAVSGFAGGLSGGGAAIVGNLATNNAPAVTEEAQQEQPVQTPPAAPVVEPMQQTGPSTEQLLEGIRDMTPAPEPLTEELQHFDNAAAIANGVQPAQQSAADTTLAAETPAEESTVINTDPAQHTPEEQATIDAYQNSIDDNLVAYIEAVRNNPGQKMPRYPLKNVDTRAADDIKRLTGIDTTGNKTQIEARAVEHILKRHGEHGNGDHSMRDVNDIARIQYVIDNYDSMEHGGKTSAYVYQNEKGRNVHAQTVVIKKKVNGTYFVVEAVPDTKKKTLFVVSAYMSQNGQKETAPSLSGDAEAYRVTSDNATKSDAVSNNSIPENVAQVNGNYSFEHLGRANAAIAEFRQSDEYKAMSHDQRVQAINEIIDYFVRVVDENEPGVAVVSDRDQKSTQDVDTSEAVQMDASNIQQQSTEDVQGIKGTGAAEVNFSGVAAYEDMLKDGNIQRTRTGAVRDVEIPKKDNDGRRVTEFAGNAVSAGVTPDSMADAIKSLVGDKKLSFDTRTNKQSLENAAADIKSRGEQAVISELATHAENKTIVDGDIEKGLVLYAQYANGKDAKDLETASEIFTNLATIANMSGRNLQLFSLLKRMTPEGQLMAVRKSVEKSIKEINNGRSSRNQLNYVPGQENVDAAKRIAKKRCVEIDEALEKRFLDAKTDEQRQAAIDDIYKNVAAQIKPTLGEAWDAWRNLAMLGNIKTHERNFGSTAAFKPYTTVKRTIGAALEKVLIKEENRTKSVLGVGKDARALLAWAKEDAKSDNVKALLGGTSSAGDDARSAIQDYRKILPGPLDAVRKKNLELMEAEDFVFKRSEYGVSLASFLKSRGYNIKQVQEGLVPKGVLDEARQYAVKEAQKATFNDRNKLSDTISKLNNVKNEGAGAIINIARKGIVPFLRTPANVVKRAFEYNPLSMANTLLKAKGDIANGRKSAADVIDEVSASLTGSAAMALGAALAAGMIPGVELVGSLDDEDELREGVLEYSVGIGGKYYSVAWLAPAMIPLFIGANLYNKFSKLGDTADAWDVAQALFEVGADALDPMLELSMLSNLNDFIDNISKEESAGDKAMVAFVNAATSYFAQGLPTIAGQIEQATEKEKNSTFVNTDNQLERIAKQTVANATKRVPGVDLYQTQKLDEWGEPVKNPDEWQKRTFDALLNPFTVSARKTDPITKEITRLNKAGYNVTPNTAARTVSYIDKDGYGHDDVRLTEEQFQKLAETQGQTARKLLDDMISSASYAALTDEQKADAIDTAYLYARKTGEIAAIEDHTGYDQSWFYDVEKGGANEIVRRVLNSGLNTSMSDLDTAWDRGYDEETFNRELQTAYESYRYAPAEMRKQVYAEAEGTAKKYIEVRDKGISHTDALAAIKNVATVKGTGSINKETGKATVRDIDRRQAIATTPNITDEAKDTLIKAFMADYDPDADKKEYTELKYNYIREYLGLSPEQYTEVYRAVLDEPSDKKDDDVVVALGYDKKTAKAIADVFNSTRSGKRAYLNWYKKNM